MLFLLGSLALGGGGFDASKPENVVEALFKSAQRENPKILSWLCHPEGTDGDCKEICALRTDSKNWDEFVTEFKDGVIDGKAKINGDTATVKFKFGPGATRDEEMHLRKDGTLWYIVSF